MVFFKVTPEPQVISVSLEPVSIPQIVHWNPKAPPCSSFAPVSSPWLRCVSSVGSTGPVMSARHFHC